MEDDISLLLDALFLARKLNTELWKAKNYYELSGNGKNRFDRLVRITGKAWDRYNRRTCLVEGIDPVR